MNTDRKESIAIFGGTFDPMTPAHLQIVRRLVKCDYIDKVVVVPTVVTNHRKCVARLFTDDERMSIVEQILAMESLVSPLFQKKVVIDDVEYSFKKIASRHGIDDECFFSETLMHVMAKYGADNEYAVVMGSDEYNQFTTWHRWDKIAAAAKIIVFERGPIVSIPNISPIVIEAFDMDSMHCSATEIRAGIRNRTIKDYVSSFGRTREDSICSMFESPLKPVVECDDAGRPTISAINTPIFKLCVEDEVMPGFRPVAIESKDWVSIIVEHGGKYLTVSQTRYGVGEERTEFVCGMVEEGEDPFDAAVRELAEETGLKVSSDDIVRIGVHEANPAFMTNRMHYFYVNLDDTEFQQRNAHFDPHERIVKSWIEKDKFEMTVLGSEGPVFRFAAISLLKNYKNKNNK